MNLEKLTTVEEEIMHIIWKLGACTVRDIIQARNEKMPVPHSTISSVVRILEKKDFLGHKAYGRTYEYFPKIEKEYYRKNKLKKFVNNYFEGSPKKLVSFLVQKENLSLDDLSDMISQLEKADDKKE